MFGKVGRSGFWCFLSPPSFGFMLLLIEDGASTIGVSRTATLVRMAINVAGEASLSEWRLDRGYRYRQSWVGHNLGFLNLSVIATHIVRRWVNQCRLMFPGTASMQQEFRLRIRVRVLWDGPG